MSSSTSNILDAYVNEAPSDAAAIDLFKGEWSSHLPGFPDSLSGKSPLFDDPRVHGWINRVTKTMPESVANPSTFKVLELGPLEGGHTAMLSKQGWDITGIESNSRAFLKCLITANIYRTRAKFLLGSFEDYFKNLPSDVIYDFICCSGVLYHLKKPSETFRRILMHAKSIGIWSHYGSPELVKNLPGVFSEDTYVDGLSGQTMMGYKQFYGVALDSNTFCGGGQDYSIWMSKDQILNLLNEYGFSAEIQAVNDSPSGPNMSIFAKRI
ncbi:MAG: class I SAM-dependent methyltransferase [Cyanobacteriota bacterium]|jgi:hypothetical protein